jgi:copper(I)-binding protein
MKVWLSILALTTALAIGVSSPGSAHQVVVGKLKIGHPWVREAAEGAPGTYSCIIEIQNNGDEPERLLAARRT